MKSLRDYPLEAVRWFLLANIVMAAWLYGGTREWAREWVSWLLVGNSALFMVGLVARFRMPRVPFPATLAVMFLLAQGWFMAWNARRQFISETEVFVYREQPLPGWPGFMDVALVTPSMILTTGLLGAFCIACDMVANPTWRQRLWLALAWTGISIVLLGLAQRLTDAPSIFWDLEQNLGWTFFAVYRYHGNAGSFINLVLPLMVGLAVRAFLAKGREKNRVIWTLASLVTAAAGFVNVSRAANVLSAVLVVGMSVWIAWLATDGMEGRRWLARFFIIVGMFLVAGILAVSFGVENTLRRWESGSWQIMRGDQGRSEAYEIMIQSAIPAAGAWGFGPGTFEQMFNIHRAEIASELQGRWDKGHSDALQTLMDWGWAGASAWAVIFCGALFRGLWVAKNSWRSNRAANILAVVGMFSLGGVMLHGLVDFPLQIASIQLIALMVSAMLWGNHPSLPSKVMDSA
jgi:hypothetical protein